jgi:Mg-chelatase subunit ChlD
MLRPTRLGRLKLEAVQEAARVFAAHMDFVPAASGKVDQVAIAGFNASGWVEQPLTSDRARVEAAISALPARMVEGTRLDLAILAGRQALGDPRRRADNNPVLVLLTDGLPNHVPVAPGGSQEQTILGLAEAAKAAGIRLYTIGVGQPGDYNAPLLSAVASRPEMFFETLDAEDLAGIYAEIAFTIACPRGRHDWGRPWP